MAPSAPAPLVVTLADGSSKMYFALRIALREDISNTLAFERDVQSATSKIGLALMEYAFDTKVEIPHAGGPRLTSRGAQTETYQTSFGVPIIARHVYQPAAGICLWRTMPAS